MSWTRRDVLALGSLALARAALGPSRVAAQTPKRGGTLSIRGWDPPLFDPMLTTAYRVHVPLSLTHSRLVRHGRGRRFPRGRSPSRATSPSRGRSRTRRRTSSSCAAVFAGTRSRP